MTQFWYRDFNTSIDIKPSTNEVCTVHSFSFVVKSLAIASITQQDGTMCKHLL